LRNTRDSFNFEGALNGSLSTLKASDLGGLVVKHILNIHQDCMIDEVLVGQALTAGQGMRQGHSFPDSMILRLHLIKDKTRRVRRQLTVVCHIPCRQQQ
jgi:hypothetical protein